MNKSYLFAVIGDPVGHSLSPVMQNAAFKHLNLAGEYAAIHVKREDLEAFTRQARKNLKGFNITVPHKNAVLPFLDSISETAALAESVNTVTADENGRLHGDSTDGIGLELALKEELQFDPRGKTVCFIGCGGVVPALAFHLAFCGVCSIRILNRTVEKAEDLCRRLQKRFPQLSCQGASLEDPVRTAAFLAESSLAVQCTSLGLKEEDPSPVDPALFPAGGLVLYDTIYKNTRFQQIARDKGIPVANGLTMLLYQGAASFRIWTGEEAPVQVMRDALFTAFREQQKS